MSSSDDSRLSTTAVYLPILCLRLTRYTRYIFFCFIYSSVLLASTTTALLRRAIHSLHTCGTKCVQENRQNDWLGCCFGESRAVEGKKLFHSLNLPLPTTLLHQRWRVLVWQALEFRVCAVTKILITQTQLAGSFFRHTSCVSLTMQRSTYDSFKTISQNPFLQTALDGFISYHWNDPRRCIHRFPIKLFPPLVQLFQLHFLFAPSATPLHSLLFFEFSLTKKNRLISWLCWCRNTRAEPCRGKSIFNSSVGVWQRVQFLDLFSSSARSCPPFPESTQRGANKRVTR